MKQLDRLMSAVELAVIFAGTTIGLGLAVLQVVLRYVFSTGIHWLEAGAVTALVWAMLMGASRAVREGVHPRVDLLAMALPPRPRAVLNTIALGAALVLAAFYARDAIHYASFVQTIGITHPEFGVSVLWPFAILPVILVFLVIRYAMVIAALWRAPDLAPEEAFIARVGTPKEGRIE
ncbi:TRAP transporter small permease [Frigidibacter sp. MR17.24]|uniref:TRAP transporter small permease n=1 Tax=Frigidibacter sp. MR17.24 TaxID=3127345 RepID=UPI003012B78F